jgi:hypothetical protein
VATSFYGGNFFGGEFFNAGGPSNQTLTQSSTFTNTSSFFAHTLTYDQTLTQSATFTGTNTFFTHTLARGAVTLTQSATYANTNSFFTHTLAAGAVTLNQSSIYTNTNQFFTHTLAAGAVTLTQSSAFTDTNQFFTHAISQGGGADQFLTQASTYTNTPSFFTHVAAAGEVVLSPALYSNAPSFYQHTISNIFDQTLTPQLYVGLNSFYQHSIQNGDTPVEVAQTPQGGAGGSNKAGKKSTQRKGHVVSAIQTQPDWYYEALLPEETPEEQVFTDEVESVIVEQDLQVDSYESLMEAVDKALSQIETLDTIHKESKASAQKYKAQIEENHKQFLDKQRRRRREEEAVLHLLLHI